MTLPSGILLGLQASLHANIKLFWPIPMKSAIPKWASVHKVSMHPNMLVKRSTKHVGMFLERFDFVQMTLVDV